VLIVSRRRIETELAMAGAPPDRETVEWMGRVLGCYAVTGNIPPSNLAALEAEVTAKLPPPMVESLARGKSNAAKTTSAECMITLMDYGS
jgi:hypothetical protein